jgi:hypothetical protein
MRKPKTDEKDRELMEIIRKTKPNEAGEDYKLLKETTQLRFVTKEEREHYFELKERLFKDPKDPKSRSHVNMRDIRNIVKHMLTNRASFDNLVSYWDTVLQTIDDTLPCLFCKFCPHKNPKTKRGKDFGRLE